MNRTESIDAVTAQVDDLVRQLYALGRQQLHQTLIANHDVADAWRCVITAQPRRARPLLRCCRWLWMAASTLLPQRWAIHLCCFIGFIAGLPLLFAKALRLHAGGYASEGDAAAPCVLLRTGVSNEPRIAAWIARKQQQPVLQLTLDERASRRLSALRHGGFLLREHWRLYRAFTRAIVAALTAFADQAKAAALMPEWMAALARTAPCLSWGYCWARLLLAPRSVHSVWFTMNYGYENAFRLALPMADAAYVEHGFPRRDLPPLQCRQYVYSHGYAAYLRSFEPALAVEVIGLDYFDKGTIDPTRTIVVASLQDWPQFSVRQVSHAFNAALAQARDNGWHLVFRTRFFDTDAFTQALDGPWDEISLAASENFAACMQRTRPAFVWTTWSTAVLDACCYGSTAVAFITPDLDRHFLTDLDEFATCITDDAALAVLCRSLAEPTLDRARSVLAAAEGAP